MVHGSEEAVAFRLWPPVAIGAPLLVGWLATLRWRDPIGVGGWRGPLGWGLVLFFVGWNGWSLWLFVRHETGLLPAPTFWGLMLFPAAVVLVRWGAILPEELFLHERFGAAYDDYAKRVRRWL